ncbi:MAG: hypothetical protein ACRDR6_30445 [Pseudonocardiaceae bacterium]
MGTSQQLRRRHASETSSQRSWTCGGSRPGSGDPPTARPSLPPDVDCFLTRLLDLPHFWHTSGAAITITEARNVLILARKEIEDVELEVQQDRAPEALNRPRSPGHRGPVAALARGLSVTVAPGATAGLPFGMSSADQLGPGGISGDLGALHRVVPEWGS